MSWSHLRFLLLRPSLITLFYTTFCTNHFAKWLGMHLRYRNSIWNKETKKIVHAQKCFYFTCEFYRFLHRGWAKFNVILQKRVPGINKVVNFKEFSRPNKEIKYLSRTKPEFKDFLRRLLTYKTFSRLYKPYRKYNALTASKLGDKWYWFCSFLSC